MEKAALGSMIKKARQRKGYTQEVIERGVKMPSMNIFIKIIEALEVSADYSLQNELSTGREYVFDEMTKKLENLTPQQRKTASDILDAYINNL